MKKRTVWKGPLDMGKFKQKIDEKERFTGFDAATTTIITTTTTTATTTTTWCDYDSFPYFFSILYVINFQVWNDERSNHHYVLIFQVVPLGLHPNVRYLSNAANRKGMSIAKRVSMVSKWDAVIWCESMDIGTAHLASSRSVWSRLIFLVDECTSKECRFHGDVVSNANQCSKVYIFLQLW